MMSMIRKSKKISAMSPEELLSDALLSPENASRVAQYLFSLGDGNLVWKTWRLLASNQSTSENSDIKTFMARSIDAKGPSNLTYDVLIILMEGGQIENDTRFSSALLSLVRRYKDSDFPAIIMLASSTPEVITNYIATENGMDPKANFSQRALRDKLIGRMIARSRDISWGNEQSGILMGSRLMANREDPIVKEMIKNSIGFPSSFMYAVFEHGSVQMVNTMVEIMGGDISAKDAKVLYPRISSRSMAAELASNVMGNSSSPIWQRMEFAEFLRGLARTDSRGWYEEVYLLILDKYVYPSDEPALFEMAVEELEKGDSSILEKINANVEMSLTYADRIIAAAKKFNVENKLSHALRVLEELSREDDEF